MVAGKMIRFKRSKAPQKVLIVKPKRKRRGPKITKILKDKTVAKVRYVDVISIDAGAAAIASHVFGANNIFDPDVTGTGHQPLMHDEYSLLYGKYRVLSSTCKVTPVASATSSLVPGLYGVFLEADGTLGYALGTSIIEDQRNKGSWGLTMLGATNAQTSLLNQRKRASFNAKKFLSPEAANDAHDQGASPAAGHRAFFQVWVASVAGNNPGSINFLVEIDYTVEYTAPLVLTPS